MSEQKTLADKKKEKSPFDSKPSIQRGTGRMRAQNSGRTYLMQERKRRARAEGRIAQTKTDPTNGANTRYVMYTGDHGTWRKA